MKRLCLIGDPVEHSLSPILQNAAIEALGLQDEYVYEAVKVPKDGLEDFVTGAKNSDIAGFSVTMPHKENIVPLLDEVADDAKFGRSVNTVQIENGRLIGHTTDGEGVVRALKAVGAEIQGKDVLVLGAGGAAKPIAISLANAGVGKLTILNRDAEKAKEISELIGGWVIHGGLDRVEKALAVAKIIINATSFGMKGNHEGESLVQSQLIRKDMVVVDLVYDPLETRLLSDAKNAGAKTIDGTSVLMHQADTQFELFTGTKPPMSAMEKALKKRLGAAE